MPSGAIKLPPGYVLDPGAATAAPKPPAGYTLDLPARRDAPPIPGEDEPGIGERFMRSALGAVNPIPGIEEWLNRPGIGDQLRASADAIEAHQRIKAGKGRPEDQGLIDRATQMNLSSSQPSVMPLGSEPATQAGVQARQGDLAGAAGTLVGGYAVPAAVGAVAPSLAEGAKSVYRGVFGADPVAAMVKALRPAAAASDFAEQLPGAMADIKTAAGGQVKNLDHLRLAASQALNSAQAALEPWMQRARSAGVQASGVDVARATRDAVPESMWLESPDQARSIADQAGRAYSRDFTVDQLRQLLKEKNAELSSFYDKATGKQQASVVSGSPQAVVKAQRDAIADTLYKTLDPQGQGAGPREIQARTGAIKEIANAAEQRRNAAIAEKPVTKAGALGKTGAALVDLPGRILHGESEAGVNNIFAPWRGTIDPLIAKAFDSIEPGAPYPAPPAGQETRLLAGPNQPGGTMYTPPPDPPASYVRGVPAQPNPSGAPRMLPAPARGPLVTPPPADPSGSVPGMPPQFNPSGAPRMLPAPGPVTAPPADPSGIGVSSEMYPNGFDPQRALAPPAPEAAPPPADASTATAAAPPPGVAPILAAPEPASASAAPEPPAPAPPPAPLNALQEAAERRKQQIAANKARLFGAPPAAERGPGWVGSIPTSELRIDAPRFQYKAGMGQGGASDKLRSVAVYDPEKGGILHVWQDPEDSNPQPFVVNGHHRAELAQRAGAPQVAVRYLDAANAQEARVKGAIINIAEDQGTSLDAARIFRQSGTTPEEMAANGLEMKGRVASEGMALSKLAEPIFRDVVDGTLAPQRGAAIAEVANHADQQSLYTLIREREKGGKRLTNDQIGELVRLNNRTPTVTESTADQAQGGLFGAEEMTRSLLPEKATVSDYIRKQLGTERKLFGVVGSQAAADTLGRTGNVIKAADNADVAARANQGLLLYDKLSSGAGPVDAALDQAAKALAAGRNANEVKQAAYRQVSDYLTGELGKLTGVPHVHD
jgi:hypothetical protein